MLSSSECKDSKHMYLICHSPFPSAQRLMVEVNVSNIKVISSFNLLCFLDNSIHSHKRIIVTLHYILCRHCANPILATGQYWNVTHFPIWTLKIFQIIFKNTQLCKTIVYTYPVKLIIVSTKLTCSCSSTLAFGLMPWGKFWL